MSARDYRVVVERTLLGMAWRDHADGDPSDPLALSPRLRLSAASDWSAAIDALLDGPEARAVPHLLRTLVDETRRVERACVGPPHGDLRADGARISPARRHLLRAIAARRGAAITRLAAADAEPTARYRAVSGIPVDGLPGCTLDVRLEPTTDGSLLGLLERRGDDPSALEVVLVPEGADGEPRTLRLAASQRALVFYEDRDPGAGVRAFAYRVE